MLAQVAALVAALIVRLKSAVAVCAVGSVASFTVTSTDAIPTELEAGVPVMAPVELLMERPAGRLVALYVYGFVPPVALMDAL
jgi:hypothetical protein